jgi:hypothetical protein
MLQIAIRILGIFLTDIELGCVPMVKQYLNIPIQDLLGLGCVTGYNVNHGPMFDIIRLLQNTYYFLYIVFLYLQFPIFIKLLDSPKNLFGFLVHFLYQIHVLFPF